MKLIEIKMADISLVELKGTPHCKKHGAMNKITMNEDKGGIWRCVHVPSNQNENTCRAGCMEVRNG